MEMQQRDSEGLLIVREHDGCPHWEAHPRPGLGLRHECWFCKWAEFRDDLTVHRHTSVCHNEKNREGIHELPNI